MAQHRRTSSRESAVRSDPAGGPPTGHRRATAGPVGEAYWSVDGAGWSSVRPGLPGHVADLLAPPIVVGVARVPASARPDRLATTRPGPPATTRPGPGRGARATVSSPDRAAPGVNRGPFLDTRR